MSIRPKVHDSVEETNRLYEQNVDKLFVDASYPLDAERVAYWLESVALGGNEDLTEYANLIAQNLRHIGFREFYDRLVQCAIEVVEICEREGREIIALAPGGFHVSNGWVLLLVWPIIRPFVTRVIIETGTFGYSSADQGWAKVSRPTLAVFCDDASFTGSQASQYVLTLDVQEGFDGTNNFKMCYLIPFIGPTASWRLLRILGGNAILLNNSERIPGLFNLLVEKIGRPRAEQLFFSAGRNKAARYWTIGECLIYFDHKLPDRTSTAQVVLALAPSYNEQTHEYGFDTLIAGCDISKYTVHRNNDFIYKLQNTIDTDFDAMGVCPPSHYKNIKYTRE